MRLHIVVYVSFIFSFLCSFPFCRLDNLHGGGDQGWNWVYTFCFWFTCKLFQTWLKYFKSIMACERLVSLSCGLFGRKFCRMFLCEMTRWIDFGVRTFCFCIHVDWFSLEILFSHTLKWDFVFLLGLEESIRAVKPTWSNW